MKNGKIELNGLGITVQRMTGNSTRQIDNYIQTLFEYGSIIVEDHWEEGTNSKANGELTRRILRRLEIEHRLSPNNINRGMKLKVIDKICPEITLIENNI